MAVNMSTAVNTAGDAAEAAAAVASAKASSITTMWAQNQIAEIQNEIALNEALNHIREELGKGVKSLAQ